MSSDMHRTFDHVIARVCGMNRRLQDLYGSIAMFKPERLIDGEQYFLLSARIDSVTVHDGFITMYLANAFYRGQPALYLSGWGAGIWSLTYEMTTRDGTKIRVGINGTVEFLA